MNKPFITPNQKGKYNAYLDDVLTVEPHGIEEIGPQERHGQIQTLFTLWFSANMGLPVWLVGSLAILLGLGFVDGVIAILIGNLIGCAILAATASMGPAIGMPQLPFTRLSFGARGAYLLPKDLHSLFLLLRNIQVSSFVPIL